MMIVPYLYLGIGIFARVMLPWLLKLYKNQGSWSEWDWRMLRGQLLGGVIVVFVLPVLIADPGGIATMDWHTAWLAGYAAADLGRLTEKLAIQ